MEDGGGEVVGHLVGVLSLVNQEGLYQLNTDFNLQVIHSTSHYITSLLFFHLKPQLKFYPQFRNAKLVKQTHVLEPICIPRALSTRTCIQQGDLFYSAGLHRNRC